MSILSSSPVASTLPAWVDMPDERQALAKSDPELYAAIEMERQRQANVIELIASENYVSSSVLPSSARCWWRGRALFIRHRCPRRSPPGPRAQGRAEHA